MLLAGCQISLFFVLNHPLLVYFGLVLVAPLLMLRTLSLKIVLKGAICLPPLWFQFTFSSRYFLFFSFLVILLLGQNFSLSTINRVDLLIKLIIYLTFLFNGGGLCVSTPNRICGYYSPSDPLTFISSRNVMLVTLVTNDKGNYPGIRAHVSQILKDGPGTHFAHAHLQNQDPPPPPRSTTSDTVSY